MKKKITIKVTNININVLFIKIFYQHITILVMNQLFVILTNSLYV